MNIGLKIKELRNAKGVTQEDLAKVVGISTQAVSKWENGGLPDIELLPEISIYFNVSIDYLFDIDTHELENAQSLIAKYIATLSSQENKFMEIVKTCWNMEKAIAGDHGIFDCTWEENIAKHSVIHSEMLYPEGISMMCISEQKPFFFICPRPKTRFNYLIEDKEKYVSAFELFGQAEILDAIIYLNSRENKQFTPNLFVKEFGVTYPRSEEIISGLLKLDLLEFSEVEIDNNTIITYALKENPAIIGLLIFIDLIVNRPRKYSYFHDSIDYYFSLVTKSTRTKK